MVDAVVLARKDDVPVLQKYHPARQAKVCVRPFVNLVRESHKYGQCKQVAVQGVDMVNFPCRKRKTDLVRAHRNSEVQIHHINEIITLHMALFRDGNLTRGEGEEVEGHVC